MVTFEKNRLHFWRRIPTEQINGTRIEALLKSGYEVLEIKLPEGPTVVLGRLAPSNRLPEYYLGDEFSPEELAPYVELARAEHKKHTHAGTC